MFKMLQIYKNSCSVYVTVNLGYIRKKLISELCEIQRLKLLRILFESCPVKASER